MSDNHQRNSAFNAAATAKIYHALLEDISKFTPDKFNHLQRGGIREGAGRNLAEMQEMLDKIPASQRAGIDSESAAYKVKEYLLDKDASHVISHHNGGSDNPNNIKWENKSVNRARGDKNMTHQEQIELDLQAQLDNVTGAVKAGIQAVPRGAMIGAITTAPFSMLRNGLRVARGEISTQDAVLETVKSTGIGIGVGATTAFTVTTIATAFPPIAVALSTISPALLAVGGVGMIQQFFKILEDHKQQVKAYYDSMTEQELDYLSQIEAELIYEHEKNLSFLDRQQELTEIIVNRPRESGVQNVLKKYAESRQIYQYLKSASDDSKALAKSSQNFLPRTNN
jgi:hypothetical protein